MGAAKTERLWLTVDETAERSGYSAQYVRRLCRDSVAGIAEKAIIEVDETSSGYLVYWPSVRLYIEQYGRGPREK
jgi:hypothetical protein